MACRAKQADMGEVVPGRMFYYLMRVKREVRGLPVSGRRAWQCGRACAALVLHHRGKKRRNRARDNEAFGDNAQSQGLNFCDSFIAVLPVAENAAERGHFSQPAGVDFLFEFDRKRHAGTVTFGEAGQQRVAAGRVCNEKGSTFREDY